ncbi:MAG: hypothetical protein GXP24_14535 [Planctomycetes bacterium]|nr:hypothetical protein [Planctomycetota bacterium]
MIGSVAKVHWVLLLAVGVLAAAAGTGWAWRNASEGNSTASSDDKVGRLSESFSDRKKRLGESSYSGLERKLRGQRDKFTITIRQPVGPPRVELRAPNSLQRGKPITVACSTCHASRPANFANRTPADLDEFHQDLTFAHGNVTCLSCHNPDNYDTLHLADGSSVEYSDVMTLCAQCHGPQTRDYRHGAHGGMIGYWDLSRGPRTRNNCVDCHDPHAPSFPAMKPTFKPRDRFLNSTIDAKKGHSEVHPHER